MKLDRATVVLVDPDPTVGREQRGVRPCIAFAGPLVYTGHMVRPSEPELPLDPVIEAYKKDIDRTLLRENLKLTPSQRLEKLQQFMKGMSELRGAARRRT